MTDETRRIMCLELKKIMQELATLNEHNSELNKDYLSNAQENIKDLIEILSY